MAPGEEPASLASRLQPDDILTAFQGCWNVVRDLESMALHASLPARRGVCRESLTKVLVRW